MLALIVLGIWKHVYTVEIIRFDTSQNFAKSIVTVSFFNRYLSVMC